MKILIAYAGKTGTTKECAGILRDRLNGQEVTLCDLMKEDPDPSEYDITVIGGAVRFGKLSKKVTKYIGRHRDVLKKTRAAYFLCCAFADRFDEYAEAGIPQDLREASIATVNFGGQIKPEKQNNFFMKAIVRAMRNEITENGESDDAAMARIIPEILPSEIGKLADLILKRS